MTLGVKATHQQGKREGISGAGPDKNPRGRVGREHANLLTLDVGHERGPGAEVAAVVTGRIAQWTAGGRGELVFSNPLLAIYLEEIDILATERKTGTSGHRCGHAC